MAQSDTAFPWVIQLLFWDTTFRSLVVFVLATDTAVNRNQARMNLTSLFQDTVQVHLFTGNPTSIQPKDIEMSIVGHQFVQLVFSVLLIVFPPLWMLLHVVVMMTVRSRIVRIPIPFSMPVRLREITTHHETLLTESIPHVVSHVLARIVLERTVGDREISVLGIEGTETVVMLTGEEHVLHSGIFHHFCPLFRIEVHRIELILQTEVPLLVFHVRKVFLTTDPVHVFRADRP